MIAVLIDGEVIAKNAKIKRSCRGGKVSWPVFENNLENWVRKQHEKGLLVSTALIQLQTKLIAQ